MFSSEHTMSSKEDKTSHGKENIYENISSIGANSMTKSIYDGSSLTSQPTADLKGGMLDMSLARRPLPGELDPFCQAYIIKPKPPLAGGTGSSTLETKPVDSDSLKGKQCFPSFSLISEYLWIPAHYIIYRDRNDERNQLKEDATLKNLMNKTF